MNQHGPLRVEFSQREQADAALSALRAAGFPDARLEEAPPGTEVAEGGPHDLTAFQGGLLGAAIGGAAGGAVGGILGLAALTDLLPPFRATLGGAAAVLTILGAAGVVMGGLCGLLIGRGIPEDDFEHHFYPGPGGRALVILAPGARRGQAEELLRQHGGELREAAR